MPNWKIHLEIGKRLSDYFKYNEKDKQLFLLGNILPDINNCFIVENIDKNIPHDITHYHTNIKSYINFYNQYKDKFNNPLVLGYYIHLYTDYYWNNDFYTKFDNKKMEHNIKREYKQQDFMVYNNKYISNSIDIDYDNILDKLKTLDRVSLSIDDLKKVDYYLKNTELYTGKLYFYKEKELDELLESTIISIKETAGDKMDILETKNIVYTAYSKYYFYCEWMISKYVLENNCIPLNRFTNWGYFLYDTCNRDLVKRGNNNLIRISDEIWCFGPIADGVLFEIRLGIKKNKKIRFFSLDKRVEDIKELCLDELEFENEVLEKETKEEIMNELKKYLF